MQALRSLLELSGISKSFPGCLANDDIDFDISEGEIHALLGQNGAGKSTLVKIIYGILHADSGALNWQGSPTTIDSPATARRHGIAMVFQHFSLFESLTVLENIALGLRDSGYSESNPSLANTANLREQTLEVSARYGLPLDPDRQVYTLSVGEKQRIEIVRCLLQSPKLLIMDEPTSVLTPQEVETLFETLQKLADEGMAILYISHKLDEIRALCTRATILRDGRKIGVADPRAETSESLATMMIGETTPALQRANDSLDQNGDENIVLEVRDLTVSSTDNFSVSLSNLNFELRAGEILGIAGVAGNGQDELLLALSGEHTLSATNNVAESRGASIRLRDAFGNLRPVGHLSPRERRRHGLSVVPEERLGHAAVPDMALYENALLTAFNRLPLVVGGWINKRRSREFTEQIIDQYDVVCRDADTPASSLSGGNLQKFVVGREIEQQPSVLVVAQPTWGVDAGAAAAIRQALLSLAEGGAGVLVVSQDLDELLQISTRVLAICGGSVSPAYPASAMDAASIGILMGGGELDESARRDAATEHSL